jgi:hypothetical protein
MRKPGTGLAVALVAMLAVASQPALAKDRKGSTSTQHTAKGQHIKEGTITVRKKSQGKPNLGDITVTKPMDKASPK